MEEYKAIQSKVNTLDKVTLQLRVALIGGLVIVAGGIGLAALNTYRWNYYCRKGIHTTTFCST